MRSFSSTAILNRTLGKFDNSLENTYGLEFKVSFSVFQFLIFLERKKGKTKNFKRSGRTVNYYFV
jgi:hypothetical protein